MNARSASALARSLSLHSARRPRPSSIAFTCPSPTSRSLPTPSRLSTNPQPCMVFQAARPLRQASSSSSQNTSSNPISAQQPSTTSSPSPATNNHSASALSHLRSHSDQHDSPDADSSSHHSLTVASTTNNNDSNQTTNTSSANAAVAAAAAATTAAASAHHFSSHHAQTESLSNVPNHQSTFRAHYHSSPECSSKPSQQSSTRDESKNLNKQVDVDLSDSTSSIDNMDSDKDVNQELSTSTISSSEESNGSVSNKMNDNSNPSTNSSGHDGTIDSSTDHPIPHTPPPLVLRTGVVCIPHPDKRDKGGEDAFFIQKHAMGVFDGVGGWASIGVDAGLYSKELARLTAAYVLRHGTNAVIDALRHAAEENHAIGTSTACVAAIYNARLVGLNLGDSGLLVIRDGQIIYQTTEQQHYFNCPYQIGTDSLDNVDSGVSIDISLRHGDWIVMGTDGLWDNVFPANVVQLIMSEYEPEKLSPKNQSDQVMKKGDMNRKDSDTSSALSDCSKSDPGAEEAQMISQKLAEMALKIANDERSNSPFAVNAQNAGHLFMGGKIDDITIISALVIDPTLQDESSNLSEEESTTRSDGQLPHSNL